jgi:hypothetical protein
VFTYPDKVVQGGVAKLLRPEYARGKPALVRVAVATELLTQLAAGRLRRAKDAQAWIKKLSRQMLTVSTVRKVLRRLGGIDLPRE